MASRGRPLPASFEARGTSVPFVTRSLQHCRLRVVDGGRDLAWEACVPAGHGDPDALGIMILPWDDLPGFSRMTERDQALYQSIDSIEDTQDPDPFTVRAAAIDVDCDREDDDGARTAARRERERDSRAERRAGTALLAAIARDCGAASGDAYMAEADADALIERIDRGPATGTDAPDPAALRVRALAFSADRLQAPSETVEARLAALAADLAPFGGIDPERDERAAGFLVDLRNRIAAMDGTMARQARTMRPQTADMTAMVRFAIKDFLDYTNVRLTRLSEVFTDVQAAIGDHEQSRKIVAATRRDVAYALDGWDAHCRTWEAALTSGEPGTLHHAVRHILAALPLMPDAEVNPDGGRGWIWQSFGAARNQMVRTLVGWSDNEVDTDLTNRLADAKKREAAQEQDNGDDVKRRRRRHSA